MVTHVLVVPPVPVVATATLVATLLAKVLPALHETVLRGAI